MWFEDKKLFCESFLYSQHFFCGGVKKERGIEIYVLYKLHHLSLKDDLICVYLNRQNKEKPKYILVEHMKNKKINLGDWIMCVPTSKKVEDRSTFDIEKISNICKLLKKDFKQSKKILLKKGVNYCFGGQHAI